MKEFVCEVCGKTFKAYQSQKRRFCSRECFAEYRKTLVGEKATNHKGKILIICEACGKQFQVYPYRKESARHCSRKCQLAKEIEVVCSGCGKKFLKKEYTIRPGTKDYFCSWECRSKYGTVECACDYCGKKYIAKKAVENRTRFCSKKCMSSWISQNLTGSKRYNWKKKIVRSCRNCGRNFTILPYKARCNRGYYCSKKCAVAYQVGENAPGWMGGLQKYQYPRSFNAEFKKRIRNRDRHICQICGKKRARHVHHINYLKGDTRPRNCILLCSSCHAKTNRNRKYWKELLQWRVTVVMETQEYEILET